MENQKCSYVYTNNSKNNKKGDICNVKLKKQDDSTYCWKHRNLKNKTKVDKSNKEDSEGLNRPTKSEEKTFIQLYNTKEQK